MPNVWMIVSVVLLIAVVALFITRGSTASAGTAIPAQDCAQKTITYLNNNLVQPGTTATLASVTEESGVYDITTNYLNRTISVFTTKDCSLLFLSSLNTSQNLPTSTTGTQTGTTTIPTSAKPTVQLYVMAFCPYGVQAEQAMQPVVKLLGSNADISVKFIVQIGGTNVSDVQSLHGANEAKEDLRQVCIMKYYPDKYWSYQTAIDANCYANFRDDAALNTCWKNASTSLGINTTKIEACAYSSEGISMLSADEALTNQYGVSGSPTLIINGVTYSGQRTPDAFKAAICSAFTTAPSACSQNLSSTGTAASGNCG